MNDDEFLSSFEECTLPFEDWTHRAHVKVAFLYLRKFDFDEAVSRMRQGVKAYNSANRVPDSKTMGYNETTTVAFMHLVHSIDREYSDTFPTSNADVFCDTHPQLLSKHVLRFFYSPERRMHPDAKHEFVEPDLTPLPTSKS